MLPNTTAIYATITRGITGDCLPLIYWGCLQQQCKGGDLIDHLCSHATCWTDHFLIKCSPSDDLTLSFLAS